MLKPIDKARSIQNMTVFVQFGKYLLDFFNASLVEASHLAANQSKNKLNAELGRKVVE